MSIPIHFQFPSVQTIPIQFLIVISSSRFCLLGDLRHVTVYSSLFYSFFVFSLFIFYFTWVYGLPFIPVWFGFSLQFSSPLLEFDFVFLSSPTTIVVTLPEISSVSLRKNERYLIRLVITSYRDLSLYLLGSYSVKD